MPVAIDASSPAVVSSIGTSLTTASFNPPDSSLLVATVMGGSSPTMSNNGAAITWTSRVSSFDVEIFTAPLPAGRTGMTVTVTNGNSVSWGLKLDVITGGNLSSPVGATGTGDSSTNNLTVAGYTSTIAGSRGIGGALDSNGLGLPSTTDDGAAWTGVFSGIRVAKAANTATAGSSVTFNFDAAGSSSAGWDWVAVEIVPALDPPRPAVYVANLTALHRAANF